ncbi:MAG: hypothetical protein AB7O13_03335 [Alphaproteobacteria bacterium]
MSDVNDAGNFRSSGFSEMSEANGDSSFGDSNFAEFITRERERLRAEREQVFNQQEELQRRLDAINREFAAIEAYETAKTGKAARQTPPGRQRQARRGSRREALLELIRQGDGLSRGELLERMGLKGDKSGEMSVSNALTALTKSNQVRREGGKYRATRNESEPTATPDSDMGDEQLDGALGPL